MISPLDLPISSLSKVTSGLPPSGTCESGSNGDVDRESGCTGDSGSDEIEGRDMGLTGGGTNGLPDVWSPCPIRRGANVGNIRDSELSPLSEYLKSSTKS